MVALSDLIARQARERPQAMAIVLGQDRLNFKELHEKVEAWAVVLHQRGIRPGDSFGLVMRNSIEFVVTFFALIRLGARAVPVNFLLKADEISFIFEDAGVQGVITQPAFLGNVLEARKKLSKLKDVVVTGTSGLPADVLSFNALIQQSRLDPTLQVAADPEGVSMVIYTSGTTGKPKGAMLTQTNFVSNVEQCLACVSLSAKDVFLCLLPMFHSFAWTVCILVPLYLGCKIVIIESIQPFDNVIKQIFRQRVSIFVAVPPIFAALLRVPFWRPLRFLNPVRICISGAAALPKAVHEKFEKKFGVPLMEGYGLTEASPVVTLNPEKRRITGSVGPALPGVELRIVDDAGKSLPQGEVGEICLRGANTMKGYYHQPEATRQAFLDEGLEWLKTGDVGHVDSEGYLFISDRKKDLIIVKGLNVYPKEIEDILLGHAAVLEAAVIGIQDETGDEIIRAFVTLKEGAKADKQELLKLCRGRLAPYKCPKDLEIRKELPKNTLGKILKRELRVMAAQSPHSHGV